MSRLLIVLGLAVPLLAGAATGAEVRRSPDFRELSGVIRSNLPGVTEAELERAATQGILNHFKGRVLLGAGPAPAKTNTAPVTKPAVYEQAYGYLRISAVEDGLATKMGSAFNRLAKGNTLKGLILDLRYATGGSYAAAAQTTELFLTNAQPLLDWGTGQAASKARKKAIQLPVAVLINNRTRGSAEALAAALRRAGAGVIVGTNSAGEASIYREFTLGDGQKIRVATGSVKLGNGEPLPAAGVRPDILVAVAADRERAWFNDPFAAPKLELVSTTNAPGTNAPRRRMNEAELVRLQREGSLPADAAPIAPAETKAATPVIQDPVLARALDVLKAVAIVQPGPRP